MIFTTAMLKEKFAGYADPAGKIMRLTQDGKLFPLVRGVYETDASVPGEVFASVIYGPSYLSFEYALAYYGLIPEAVVTYTSATFGKKKAKCYENAFGRYTYRDVPDAAYPFGVRLTERDGYAYRLATPEKALCDQLWAADPVHGVKELSCLLFEDMRIDEGEFAKLDRGALADLCGRYRANNMKYLAKLIGREL